MNNKRKYLPTLSELVDRLSIAQLKEVFITDHKEEYAQEIKDIGTLAQALEAHGIAIEPSRSETTLTINTDLGQATIRFDGPGVIKYGVY